MLILISRLLQPKYLLILIGILFLFTRLYKVTEIPPSVYWDEASIGYNGYSIAQTGKDEWGESFPVHFRAFGEFKLPVYIYATALSVKLFGLNAFSVRLPAALFSLGVVVLTYFLAKKLLGNTTAGLLSSLFIVLSPWFFIFSRTGYEATAGLMFYLLAIYFFLKFDRNAWYIVFSVANFVLSAYSYNSFRLIVPLTILILIVFHIKNIANTLKRNPLPLVLSVIILALSIIPIYRLYVYDAGISRLQVVSSTKVAFIKNYLSHISLDFLILHGDKNLRNQQEDFGQINPAEFLLLLLGILFIICRRLKSGILMLLLLLIGPIPAAITKESPHALRAISMIPFISIISAEGVYHLGKIVKNRYLLNLTIIIIFFGFFLNYFLNFLNVYPVKSSKDWQYGYKKIFTTYKDTFDKYDRVIISDEYAQPYIFALFYLQYDPNKFRQEVVRNSVDQWGFSTVSSFGKFEFGKVEKLLEKNSKNILVFASKEEMISNLNPSATINFLNGEVAFRVYELK